jgi:hypothetical protein
MNSKSLLALALFGATTLASSAFAQSMNDNSAMPGHKPHDAMMMHETMPAPINMPMFTPPPALERPAFAEFPTPDELAQLVPPEPLTEEKIKQRFAAQRELLQKAIEQDRQRAEKYARDFDRYQKYQADQLASIMSAAEKQRDLMLKRLELREQRVLENFRQRNQPVEAPKAH